MFKDIMAFLKSDDSKKRKISPFIILLCAIIIIVPTTFALLNAYLNDDSNTVVTNTVVKVSLYDADGKELATEEIIESNVETSSIAKIFYAIISNKAKTDTPSNLGDYNFKLNFSRSAENEQFLCYFTDSAKTSYLKDSHGTFFTMTEEDYNLFLNSDFSQPVYPGATPPKLITGDGETIIPTEANWYYLKQNKESFLATVHTAQSADTTYNISGAINLSFEQLPDTCTAQISDEADEVIYDGSLEELAFVKPQTDTLLKAKVTAEWNNKEDCTSYGQVTYSFNIILGNKAEFSVTKSTVTAGDFIIVSVKNAQSASKVIYSATKPTDVQADAEISQQLELLYSYKPVFIVDGNSARAIIPFHAQLPAHSFAFSIAYGATEESFTINIQERKTEEVTLPHVSFEISPVVSKAGIDSFNELLKNLKPSTQNIRFFRGRFSLPTELEFNEGYSFGDTLKSSDGTLSFDAVGTEFTTSSSEITSVKALNIGVVLEASYCQYLGNYVVIEHGMGLRTWYCGLSDFNVKAGDVVTKGELIGKSGTSPTTSGNGFILLCSIYDTLVSPDSLWNAEFTFDNEN